ncbi:MAG: hypothetical protein ACYTEQ_09345 [Planctomycetota bacterium]|jgi:hypothetical protein
MPDTGMSFERKFGQLADNALNEKAPSLLEYRVGFQIIDKSEDETKAIGIAAFVVGKSWLYMPIFFIDGRLRGFDLLYVKQKDMFIPSKDNWVNMIKEQGLSRLGHGIDYSKEKTRRAYAPDEITIYTNPATLGRQKIGSLADTNNSLIDSETLTKMMTNYGNFHPNLDVYVPRISKTAGMYLFNTVVSDPEFANATFRFYGPDALHDISHKIAAQSLPPGPKPDEVQFFDDLSAKEAQDLDDSEKELLASNGLYIRDTRTNHSRIFQYEVDSCTLQNPTAPGVYQVFMRDGSYKTMIVVFPTCYNEMPDTLRRSEVIAGRPTEFVSRDIETSGRPVALIDPESPKDYVKTIAREVFVKPPEALTEKQLKGIDNGKDATMQSVSGLKEGSCLLLVRSGGDNGASTATSAIETKVLGKKTGIDGNSHVVVYAGSGHMMPEPAVPGNHPGQLTLEFTGKPGRLVRRGRKILVPEGTRMFSVTEEDNHPQIVFGDVETAYQVMHKSAGLRSLRVFATGDMAQVEGEGRTTGYVEKEAALRHLVLEHGIYAGQATQLLKEASRAENRMKTYNIKYAAPYDLSAYGDMQLPFQGGPSGRYEYAVTDTVKSSQGKPHSGPTDAEGRPILPNDIIQQAMRAADAGIQEVFDVAVLQGLVDVADLSELRKDFLADMVKGMDRTGRMLFLFYWHNSEFEEKYGKDDMKKLEDTLKQTFAKLGDLILFLKEKSDYTTDLSESLFGDLSEDIGIADVEA